MCIRDRHKAVLGNGCKVVVKVQRKGIYETMARDISLLHKAVKLLPPVSLKGVVDLDMVLDELWAVTREEMNFLTEAANMEEFARRKEGIAYIGTPVLYQEYTTLHVLVMEYIEGYRLDDLSLIHILGSVSNSSSLAHIRRRSSLKSLPALPSLFLRQP